MKVWNLRCDHDHAFEGWFGSEEDFQSQRERGLLTCPMCGTSQVTRMPSAPRLNLGSSATQPPNSPNASAPPAASASALEGLHAAWGRLVQHALAHTEDVGERFAEEARRIHYGESPERGIRGQASAEEREALNEEGIEVVTLPMPWAPKGPLQ